MNMKERNNKLLLLDQAFSLRSSQALLLGTSKVCPKFLVSNHNLHLSTGTAQYKIPVFKITNVVSGKLLTAGAQNVIDCLS